jgi:hypothetical protein
MSPRKQRPKGTPHPLSEIGTENLPCEDFTFSGAQWFALGNDIFVFKFEVFQTRTRETTPNYERLRHTVQ